MNKVGTEEVCFSKQVRELDIKNLKYFFSRINIAQGSASHFVEEVTRLCPHEFSRATFLSYYSLFAPFQFAFTKKGSSTGIRSTDVGSRETSSLTPEQHFTETVTMIKIHYHRKRRNDHADHLRGTVVDAATIVERRIIGGRNVISATNSATSQELPEERQAAGYGEGSVQCNSRDGMSQRSSESNQSSNSLFDSDSDSDLENQINVIPRRNRRAIYSTSELEIEQTETQDDNSEVWTSKTFVPNIHQFAVADSGIKKNINRSAKILDFFQLLLSEELVELIAREREYWSKDKLLRSDIFGELMTRDRYFKLLQMLHFTDDVNHSNDRLYKIRNVVEMLRKSFNEVFQPFQRLCIDESLLLYKGRLSFKQYIPLKRSRCGIKSFILSDCNTGFVQDLIIYAGSSTTVDSENASTGKSGAIVETLMKPHLGKGHTLYVDNWYASPALFKFLYNNGTNACGIVIKRRKGMPKFDKRLKKGEAEFRSCDNLIVLKWMDKEVYMISTMHTAQFKTLITHGGAKVIHKPVCVLDYNNSMGAVDKADMVISTVNSTHKSLKWYRKFFFHLVDICVWNAYCLYKHKTKQPISMAKFHLQLIKEILEKYHENISRPHTIGNNNPLRLIERHFPSVYKAPGNKPRTRCVVCRANNRRRETRINIIENEESSGDEVVSFRRKVLNRISSSSSSDTEKSNASEDLDHMLENLAVDEEKKLNSIAYSLDHIQWNEFANRQQSFTFTGKITETNRYAEQKLQQEMTEHARLKRWKPTTCVKIKKCIVLMIWMGLVQTPLVTCWSKEPIYNFAFPRSQMPRNRFELLLAKLHFANNETIEEGSRLGKVLPFLNLLVDNYQKVFLPGEDIVIDETMVLWRGRLIFRIYMVGESIFWTRYQRKKASLPSGKGLH
ncbi:hypothetical protein M0804_015378 [Polistes exclamans]|nr:hypothetical protein M0804_015378 [Polistes exclamans]